MDKLEAKLPEDANRWQAADEFLELATSEEFGRLHDLQQACIAKMPLGSKETEYIRYATDAEQQELSSIVKALTARHKAAAIGGETLQGRRALVFVVSTALKVGIGHARPAVPRTSMREPDPRTGRAMLLSFSANSIR